MNLTIFYKYNVKTFIFPKREKEKKKKSTIYKCRKFKAEKLTITDVTTALTSPWWAMANSKKF